MATHVRPAELLPAPSPASRQAAGKDEGEVFWDVSPATYRLVWLTLLLLYVCVTLYLLAIAGGYYVLMYMPSFSYYAATFNLIPVADIPIVIVLYTGVIAMYALHIFQFVYYSLRYQTLMLPATLPSLQNARLRSALVLAPQSLSSPGVHQVKPILRRLMRTAATRVIKPLQREVFSTSGLCGVRGDFFEPVMMLREVVEITIQTAQAYMCSRQTTKLWINTTFAVLIVLNCYSSPLLHRFGKSSEGATRVTVLSVDLALDLVWFTVIPTLLWFPYFAALFQDELVLYRDTYIIEGVMELPALFLTSLLDGLVKLWPPVSIYFTIRKIELLTRQIRTNRVDASCVAVNSKRKLVAATVPRASAVSRKKKCGVMRERFEKWLRVLLICWGHAIAVIYVYASFVYAPSCTSGCQLVLRPWFRASGSCDCAALEINCLELQIEGSASQIHDTLHDATYSQGLLSLIITHCPALHIPPAIHSLSNLYGLMLLNCTVVSWDDDAAITSGLFPHLGHVLLVHTFVSEIPKALLHGELPSSLVEIGIIASNLSTLPANLHEKWPHVTTMLLEYGRFSEYPPVLRKMAALETISLYKNEIASIPDDALSENKALRFLIVSENPLSALPSSLSSRQSLVRVSAMRTKIGDASAALKTGDAKMLSHLRFLGFESPMCANDTSLGETREVDAWLYCDDQFFTYEGGRSYGYYPLEAKLTEKRFVPHQ